MFPKVRTSPSRIAALLFAVPLLGAAAGAQANPGLEWSTFLGGSDHDVASPRTTGVFIAPDGDVVVSGGTRSWDFPVTASAFDTTYNGSGPRNNGDAFITRLAADGSKLRWSTYLGGSGDDRVRCIVGSPGGVITVCGWTNSNDFPVSTLQA